MSAPDIPDDPDRRARRNVAVLVAAQALLGAQMPMMFTIAGLAGQTLAANPCWATLPITAMVVGSMLAANPLSALMQRFGRRAGFVAGALGGMAGAITGAAGLALASFPLFVAGALLSGIYMSAQGFYRFAAADTASEAFRPKAISWVMAGGVFSGILGPQLVNLTMNMWLPYLFLVSFVVQGLIAILNYAVLAGTQLPKPAKADLKAGRPLMEIARQPRFIIAATCGIISYALMNLLMTSAPLAMKMCGLSLVDANNGIQWHVLGMFAPSFFTGNLVARFGAERVVAAGLALIGLAAVVGLMGITVWHFWIGLVLLGVGWNFGFIGASAMVVETHRPEERNKVQSFNDFLVFGFMAVTSFSSGQILAASGWNLVNIIAFPGIAIAAVALLASGRLFSRPAAKA